MFNHYTEHVVSDITNLSEIFSTCMSLIPSLSNIFRKIPSKQFQPDAKPFRTAKRCSDRSELDIKFFFLISSKFLLIAQRLFSTKKNNRISDRNSIWELAPNCYIIMSLMKLKKQIFRMNLPCNLPCKKELRCTAILEEMASSSSISRKFQHLI